MKDDAANPYTICEMDLIQIVPGLPPKVDGIGDYALQLARQLRDRHGIRTAFLVCDPGWQGSTEVDGYPVHRIAKRDTAAFFAGIEECRAMLESADSKILLHFSVFSYEKRGCPFWIVDALEAFQKAKPGLLNTVFHELEVSGAKPWSSSFWVPPIQVGLIKRVARLGKFQYTNIELHRGKLEDWGSGRISLIPNFSTLGEPTANPPFSGRRRQIVIFGRWRQREWTYQKGRNVLVEACQAMGAERIVDIGEPFPNAPAEIGGIPILACGRLPVEQVNEWMATSVATFTYYPVPFLGKSSIFAVSCAHGTIPLICDDWVHPHSCPGMEPEVDYFTVPLRRPLGDLEAISAKVFENYQARASWMAADKLAKGLDEA